MRILVVDDSKVMRGIVMRTLRQAGLGDDTFLEAASGTEALEVLARSPAEVVIADLNMPNMDGLQLLETMRARGLDTAFGLLTSEPAKARDKALAQGALFVIGKPVTVESIKDALAPLRGSGPLPVPTGQSVGELLSGLLGRAVTQRASARAVLASTGPMLAGTFGDGSHVAGLIACDLELSVRLALAMLGEPAARAEELVARRELPENLLESLRELLGVCSSLFNAPGHAPVALQSTHTQLRTLPPRVVAMCISPTARLELEVEISGYGQGHLHICLA